MRTDDQIFEESLKNIAKLSKENDINSFPESIKHPADVAEWFENATENEKITFVNTINGEDLSLLPKHLSQNDNEFILKELDKKEKKSLLQNLPDDVLTDVLQDIDENQDGKGELYELLGKEQKKIAEGLLIYPENTAGGRMTTNIAVIKENYSIQKTISLLEKYKEVTEILSRIYVIDEKNKLIGRIRLRDLTFNHRNTKIADVLVKDQLSINANKHQEEALNILVKYDLIALPVVNDENEILGVITHDDAMEIMQEESTEDIEKFSAISGKKDDSNYLTTSIFIHFRRRIIWIVSLAFVSIVSGLVILHFEKTLSKYFILALYMPTIVAAGGNAGGQAATMVIRAMSLGEFTQKAFFKVVTREISIGFSIGLIVALAIGIQIIFFPIKSHELDIMNFASTVMIALIAQVTISNLFGASLPIIAKTIKIDPAAVAHPAITSIVDILGLFIYLGLAKVIINV